MQRPTIDTSSDSVESTGKDTTNATSQTSRQWSDEVAAQDEETSNSGPASKDAPGLGNNSSANGGQSKPSTRGQQAAFNEAVDRALKNRQLKHSQKNGAVDGK